MILPNLRWSHVSFFFVWLVLLSWSGIYEKQLVTQEGWPAIVNEINDKAIYILALAGLGMDKLKLSDNKGEEQK